MAVNPFQLSHSLRVVMDYCSKARIGVTDGRRDVLYWLQRQGKEFTPKSVMEFLGLFRIDTASSNSTGGASRSKGREPMTPRLALFLRRLIYFYCHSADVALSPTEKADFNRIRRDLLTPFLNGNRSADDQPSLTQREVKWLFEELKKRKRTQRWAYVIDFIYRFELNVSEVCAIRFADFRPEGDRYFLSISGSRRGNRVVEIPKSYLDEARQYLIGKIYLFETRRSTDPSRQGCLPIERRNLTSSIKAVTLRFLGRQITPREILKAKRKSPVQGDSPESGQTF